MRSSRRRSNHQPSVTEMAKEKYSCPYCGSKATLSNVDFDSFWRRLDAEESDHGETGLFVHATVCPNEDCRKMKLYVGLYKAAKKKAYEWKPAQLIQNWQLLPESEAKIMPDYLPDAIGNDYLEACRIRDLSPKASATLARRCLQGMIRDFWGISKSRLKDEVDALKDKVDKSVWD